MSAPWQWPPQSLAGLQSGQAANAAAIAALQTSVAANTAAIATNTAAISANTTAIAANTTAIAGLSLDVGSERWKRPATPHADDEECDKTLAQLLAAGWNLYDSSGNVVSILDDTIDIYSNDAANQHINGNTYRSSWTTFKIRNNNTRYYFMKPITMATNELAWTRVGVRATPADDASDLGLVICPASAGKPDFTDATRIEILWSLLGAVGLRLTFRINAAFTYNQNLGANTPLGILPYIGLGKIGTTWHAYAAGEGLAQPQYLGNAVQAMTPAYVGWVGQVNSGNAPGSGTTATDFLRFKNTASQAF